ncbi:unnamed protein product [Prunus brigantina]
MIGNPSLLRQCLPYNGHDTGHHGNGDQMLISYTTPQPTVDGYTSNSGLHVAAVHFPKWREAMVTEFNALLKNQTWVLIPHSQQHVVGCKWVFKLKRKLDGSIERYKACLIAKGFHQQPGIDFDETFSLVVKPTTVRIILALAVSFGWPLRQLDVNNAFLHGYLDTTVFMSQPPSRLLVLGFNDIVAFYSSWGNQPSLISSFFLTLGQEFELTEMGPLSYFLGLEAISTTSGLLLSQTKDTVDLLKRHSMTDCKPCSTLFVHLVSYPLLLVSYFMMQLNIGSLWAPFNISLSLDLTSPLMFIILLGL